MTLGVVVLVLVAVVVVALAARAVWPPAPPTTEAPFDPADLGDLEQRFAAVTAEERAQAVARVAGRLELVVARRVPVRVLEPAPGSGCARVRFADGTTVLVRGTRPGNAAVLAARVRSQRVLLRSCRPLADGAHLVFTTPQGDLDLVATGLDQPD